MSTSDKLEHLKKAGFTSEEIELLKKMEQGDVNNKKGRFYEECFTILQVLEFTNKQDIENSDVQILNNELSYVDDLQIIYQHNNQKYKDNFQLKNSPTTGKWNKKLEKTFNLQKKYDNVFHQDKHNTLYLICSDKDTINFNNSKDVSDIISQFYPYHDTPFEMLQDEETKLRQLLQKICPDKTQHETAFRLLKSTINNGEQLNISLDKLWEQVLEASKPNLFALKKWFFSDAFRECCKQNDFQIGSDTLSFREWNCTVTEDLVSKINNVVPECWQKITTSKALFDKLKELSTITG